MSKYNQVLFVSTDGTCRSMWAQAIFMGRRNQKDAQTANVTAESRGLIVLFEEPANPKAIAIAKSNGYEMEQAASKLLTAEDFGENVLVLTMTEQLKKNIYDKFENAINVYSMREYTETAVDIEAVHGGDLQAYGECFEYLEKVVDMLYEKEEL